MPEIGIVVLQEVSVNISALRADRISEYFWIWYTVPVPCLKEINHVSTNKTNSRRDNSTQSNLTIIETKNNNVKRKYILEYVVEIDFWCIINE